MTGQQACAHVLRVSVCAAAVVQLGCETAAAYTSEQVNRGEALYRAHCASCHGAALEGAAGPALTGSQFVARWSDATNNVNDLLYVLRSSMPRPAVGSLTPSEYLDLLALLLARNGLPPGDEPLRDDPEKLAAIRITTTTESAAPTKQVLLVGERGRVPTGSGPTAADLRRALDRPDWLHHTRDTRGTRYSSLAQIDRQNVAGLQATCIHQLGSTESFVTGPIVYESTMYVTTARLTVAVDAASCRELWRHRWEPQDKEVIANNRGVAVQDGYVVRGTADGYLLALDAADGRLLWARQIAHPAAGESITMPPLILDGRIFIGPAGSELNVQGWIGAFELADGTPVWRFNTVPKSGEPGFDTWQNDPDLPVGGGAIWTPLAFNAERGELYVPVSNPAPDFPAHLRPGANLYTNSLVALDAASGRLKWFRQLVPNDDKDWDLTQVSPLIDVEIDGAMRRLVIAAGKDGIVTALDRESHEVLYRTEIGTRLNTDAPVTAEGTHYCPGTLGGIQWNGPAWYPPAGLLIVPSVDWCFTATLDPEFRLVPGQLYMGGTMEPDDESQGFLTAIDARTGEIRWQYRSEEPMVAAVTTTAGGLAFTGEDTGDLIALDAETGKVLYRFHTGGAMAGGVVTYAVNGRQYVAVATGSGSILFGGRRGAASVVVFTLPSRL